jgi:hypothetical protein
VMDDDSWDKLLPSPGAYFCNSFVFLPDYSCNIVLDDDSWDKLWFSTWTLCHRMGVDRSLVWASHLRSLTLLFNSLWNLVHIPKPKCL